MNPPPNYDGSNLLEDAIDSLLSADACFSYPLNFEKTKVALVPPNPKLLDMATSTRLG